MAALASAPIACREGSWQRKRDNYAQRALRFSVGVFLQT